jgi:leucyl-tRNA synthetase
MEYNTMPGWAGSSWYFLRYMDPKNDTEFVDKEKVDYWQNVDLYIGGSEHATGHLLYARFWTKFLYDLGYVPFDEPFKKLINQGMILGRSSFACSISSVGHRSSDGVDRVGINLENIYLSSSFERAIKQVFDENPSWDKKSKISFTRDQIRFGATDINNPILNTLKDKLFSLTSQDTFKLGIAYDSVRSVNIDIKYIENDVLDIEAASNDPLFDFLKGAIFIKEDNGTYICGSEVEKMSKSKYNVQTPDELVEKFGADTLRMYEMFLGPLEQSKPWDTQGINGVHNFLRKVWRLVQDKDGNMLITEGEPTKEALKTLHKTIKKVGDDLERFSFNTGVSNFMICVNELTDQKCHNKAIIEQFIILLSSYAPHICEELWVKLGHEPGTVGKQPFPAFNPDHLIEANHKYPVSFNGKMRFTLELPTSLTKEEIEKEVLANEEAQKWLEGGAPKKVIVVPGRIVNIVH